MDAGYARLEDEDGEGGGERAWEIILSVEASESDVSVSNIWRWRRGKGWDRVRSCDGGDWHPPSGTA